jgi:glucosylceramidase
VVEILSSIGASDLSSKVYSYNDLPTGQTDPDYQNSAIDENKVDLIPILKMILQINPQIKFLVRCRLFLFG